MLCVQNLCQHWNLHLPNVTNVLMTHMAYSMAAQPAFGLKKSVWSGCCNHRRFIIYLFNHHTGKNLCLYHLYLFVDNKVIRREAKKTGECWVSVFTFTHKIWIWSHSSIYWTTRSQGIPLHTLPGMSVKSNACIPTAFEGHNSVEMLIRKHKERHLEKVMFLMVC